MVTSGCTSSVPAWSADVQLEPVLSAVRANLAGQVVLGGMDPQVEAAAAHLTDTLGPALRNAAIELAQQAAAEIDAQLPDHAVAVVLNGADVELRVDERAPTATEPDEELDARITLRLPPSLKQKIEWFASVDGESVNSWVVDALNKRARRNAPGGRNMNEEFDL
jgi:hypothetical protein